VHCYKVEGVGLESEKHFRSKFELYRTIGINIFEIRYVLLVHLPGTQWKLWSIRLKWPKHVYFTIILDV